MVSCTDKYNEDVFLVAGIYEANVVGVSGPFLISVLVDHGNDILIDAPFDGEYWYVVEAHINNEEEIIKEKSFKNISEK